MVFDELLKLIDNEPVFDSSLLMAGNINPEYIRTQLSRWVTTGKIYQLRRGVYALAPPYQKIKPHPFLIANRLQKASYVSLQSALAYYGMIPDTVNRIVSVTTVRTESIKTPLGDYDFRHIQNKLFFGYQLINLQGQYAFVATPEKALLDLIYLVPKGDTEEFLFELRLQNLAQVDFSEIHKMASIFKKAKIQTAIEIIAKIKENENLTYEDL
jgi:predicted transcriptional regulator of viral defense system